MKVKYCNIFGNKDVPILSPNPTGALLSPLGSAWGKRMTGGTCETRRRHMAKQKPTSSREGETEKERQEVSQRIRILSPGFVFRFEISISDFLLARRPPPSADGRIDSRKGSFRTIRSAVKREPDWTDPGGYSIVGSPCQGEVKLLSCPIRVR